MNQYKVQRGWKFLIVELLVVFIGVYGAFYLSTLQEEKRDRMNRVNYYKTFMLNLDDLYAGATRVKTEVDSAIVLMQNNPGSPIRLNRNIDFTSNMLIVRGGFESENFTTIGQDYLASLDRGSNLISIISKRCNYLEEETRKFLIYGGNERVFREWQLQELQSISGFLEMLQLTISEGAVPETKLIIQMIEAGS